MRRWQRSSIPILPPRSVKGRAALLAALGALLAGAVLLSLRCGSQDIPFAQLLAALRGGQQEGTVWRILVHVRVPRTLAALAAGCALAASRAKKPARRARARAAAGQRRDRRHRPPVSIALDAAEAGAVPFRARASG